MRIFEVQPADWWGDYSRTLLGGHASRTRGGTVWLDRAGPKIPPISIPDTWVGSAVPWAGDTNEGVVVVTPEAKEQLSVSGLRIGAFRRARKGWIVRIPWHEWEGMDEPPYTPDGEPQDYMRRIPSASAALRMGPIFSLDLPAWRHTFYRGYRRGESQTGVDEAAPEPQFDLVCDTRTVLATRAFVDFAERSGLSKWLEFVELPVEPKR